MKTGALLLLLFFCSGICFSRQLKSGGLASNGITLTLVGNNKENQLNQTKVPTQIIYLNIDDSKEKNQFVPQMQLDGSIRHF